MKRLLTSCFGLGWLPLAPGTWGSLPVVIFFWVLSSFGICSLWVMAVMIALVLGGSLVCVKFAPSVVAATGKTDPGEIVADEVAGQALTFLFVASFPISKIWAAALLGFVLFRIFDIVKPWPVRAMEKLPAGWGILCDDLAAGVYAGIVLLACYGFWCDWFRG